MRFSASIVLTFAIALIFFQNCSNFGFTYIETLDASSQSTGLILEKGKPATNKKVLSAEWRGLKGSDYLEMRLFRPTDNPDSSPWVPFVKETTFDLANDFSPSGLLDNEKVVIGELKTRQGKVLRFIASIILDTLAPKLSVRGLLARGPQGKFFSLNEKVALDYQSEDLDLNGRPGSGLSLERGLRVATSSDDNCGNEQALLTQLNWSQYESTYELSWPKAYPRENFFVCIFTEDRAGNRASILSAPMTSVWQLVAGNSDLGDGGSLTSDSLRFNHPTSLAADSKGNLYILEPGTRAIRKVDTQGIVTHFLGDGKVLPLVAGRPSLQQSVGNVFEIAIDREDRLYLASYSGLARIRLSDLTQPPEFLTEAITVQAMTFDNDNNLFAAIWLAVDDNQPQSTSSNYILKVPYRGATNAEKIFSRGELISKFKYAGSGSVVSIANPAPLESSANDVELNYVTGLAVATNGDLFIGGYRDGVGRPFGEHSISVARQTANGLKVYKLATNFSWTGAMELVEAAGKRTLVVAGHPGLGFLDVTSLDLPLTQLTDVVLHQDLKASTTYGVAVVRQLDGQLLADPVIYAASTSQSKLNRLTSSLQLQGRFGREQFYKSDRVATTSTITDPSAPTEDSAGNIYFFEPLQNIVRKVSADGNISVAIGVPKSDPSVQPEIEITPSLSWLLDGSAYAIGYFLEVLFEPLSNSLLISNGSRGAIGMVKLSDGSTQLGGNSTHTTYLSPYGAPIFAIGINNTQAFVARFLTVTPFGGTIESFDLANFSQAPSRKVGDTSYGAAKAGTALSTPLYNVTAQAFDSKGRYYFSENSLFRLENNSIVKIASGKGYISMAIIDDDAKSYVFGTTRNGLSLVVLNESGTVVDEANLCLPGTALSSPKISKARDGSLLISDVENNRVLKALLKNAAGKIDLTDLRCL